MRRRVAGGMGRRKAGRRGAAIGGAARRVVNLEQVSGGGELVRRGAAELDLADGQLERRRVRRVLQDGEVARRHPDDTAVVSAFHLDGLDVHPGRSPRHGPTERLVGHRLVARGFRTSRASFLDGGCGGVGLRRLARLLLHHACYRLVTAGVWAEGGETGPRPKGEGGEQRKETEAGADIAAG
eukprot:scaffold22088_cov114-Isochrysis_galbana.AAC.5